MRRLQSSALPTELWRVYDVASCCTVIYFVAVGATVLIVNMRRAAAARAGHHREAWSAQRQPHDQPRGPEGLCDFQARIPPEAAPAAYRRLENHAKLRTLHELAVSSIARSGDSAAVGRRPPTLQGSSMLAREWRALFYQAWIGSLCRIKTW